MNKQIKLIFFIFFIIANSKTNILMNKTNKQIQTLPTSQLLFTLDVNKILNLFLNQFEEIKKKNSNLTENKTLDVLFNDLFKKFFKIERYFTKIIKYVFFTQLTDISKIISKYMYLLNSTDNFIYDYAYDMFLYLFPIQNKNITSTSTSIQIFNIVKGFNMLQSFINNIYERLSLSTFSTLNIDNSISTIYNNLSIESIEKSIFTFESLLQIIIKHLELYNSSSSFQLVVTSFQSHFNILQNLLFNAKLKLYLNSSMNNSYLENIDSSLLLNDLNSQNNNFSEKYIKVSTNEYIEDIADLADIIKKSKSINNINKEFFNIKEYLRKIILFKLWGKFIFNPKTLNIILKAFNNDNKNFTDDDLYEILNVLLMNENNNKNRKNIVDMMITLKKQNELKLMNETKNNINDLLNPNGNQLVYVFNKVQLNYNNTEYSINEEDCIKNINIHLKKIIKLNKIFLKLTSKIVDLNIQEYFDFEKMMSVEINEINNFLEILKKTNSDLSNKFKIELEEQMNIKAYYSVKIRAIIHKLSNKNNNKKEDEDEKEDNIELKSNLDALDNIRNDIISKFHFLSRNEDPFMSLVEKYKKINDFIQKFLETKDINFKLTTIYHINFLQIEINQMLKNIEDKINKNIKNEIKLDLTLVLINDETHINFNILINTIQNKLNSLNKLKITKDHVKYNHMDFDYIEEINKLILSIYDDLSILNFDNNNRINNLVSQLSDYISKFINKFFSLLKNNNLYNMDSYKIILNLIILDINLNIDKKNIKIYIDILKEIDKNTNKFNQNWLSSYFFSKIENTIEDLKKIL